MKFFKQQWFQLIACFSLGTLVGIWQYIPTSPEAEIKQLLSTELGADKPSSESINQTALRDTAEIEPLMALRAPEMSDSIQDWYEFALSFDDLKLGKRYRNSGQTTPLLAWYAYIAKHKPQAIYKLYNQKKLDKRKLRHLLQLGFLKYWDEHINDVDTLLVGENQAVLNLAQNKGVDETRRRVSQAIFNIVDKDVVARSPTKLSIDNLLFAMETMTDDETQHISAILENGIFRIDPRQLYRLKLSRLYESESQNPVLSRLIEKYSNNDTYKKRSMSKYLADGALLGNQKYIEAMIKDVETNANQPTNFYCAACGLALTSDGLIAYPLAKASKKDKVKLSKNDTDEFIFSKKGFLQ